MIPSELPNVTAVTKANVYFGGGVVSHTLHMPDNSRKTLGIIRPGSYHFSTSLAERMEIVAGACSVRLDGHDSTTTYAAGDTFDIPGKSGFTIEVADGLCEYICSFLS